MIVVQRFEVLLEGINVSGGYLNFEIFDWVLCKFGV